MIAQDLQKMIGEAMKARDEVRLSTLRLLSSAFNYERIEKQHELSEEEELVVIRKEAKKRKDAIETYKKLKAKNPNAKLRQEREEKELKILQEFLPAEPTEEDIKKVVNEVVTDGMQIGQAIGLVKSKLPNSDGAIVANLVRQKLTND